MKLQLTLAKKDLSEDIIQLYSENEDKEVCRDDFFELVSMNITEDKDTVFLVWSEFDNSPNEELEPTITITEYNYLISDILHNDIQIGNFIKFNIFEFDSYNEAIIYLTDFYDGRRLTYSPEETKKIIESNK